MDMGPNFKSCRLIYPPIMLARYNISWQMVVEQKTKTNVNIDLLNFTNDHLYSHSSLFLAVFDINFVDCILLDFAGTCTKTFAFKF